MKFALIPQRVSPASQLLILNYGAQLLTILSGVLLARGLEPNDRGSLALYLAALTISAQVVNAPLGELAIVRWKNAQGTIQPAQRQLSTKVLGWLLIAVAASSVVQMVTHLEFAFPLAVAYLALNSMSTFFAARLIVDRQVSLFGGLKVLNIVAVIAGLVIVSSAEVPQPARLIAFASVFLASELITAIIAGFLVATKSKPKSQPISTTSTTRTGTKTFLLAALLTGVLGQSYDRLLLLAGTAFSSRAEVAFTSVALSTLAPISVIGTALIPLKLAKVQTDRGHASSRPKQVRFGLSARAIAVVGVLTVGLALYLALLTVLIPVVFGEQYQNARTYAWALTPGTVLLVAGRLRSANLRSSGDALGAIGCEIATFVIFLASVWLLSRGELPMPWPLLLSWSVVGATLCVSTAVVQRTRRNRDRTHVL